MVKYTLDAKLYCTGKPKQAYTCNISGYAVNEKAAYAYARQFLYPFGSQINLTDGVVAVIADTLLSKKRKKPETYPSFSGTVTIDQYTLCITYTSSASLGSSAIAKGV